MKNKDNDFAYQLSRYFQIYLPNERGFSTNTIDSYRETFKQLLQYCQNAQAISPEKVSVSILTPELIKGFLDHLESSGKSVSTRNQRLAAIKAFFKYLQCVAPEYLFESKRIFDVKRKKQAEATVNYLTMDGIGLILEQPTSTVKSGYRDMLLLTLLYDSGARVSEIIGIRIGDIRLNDPATIILTGKGGKSRIVPLSSKTAQLIKNYIIKERLNEPKFNCRLLFNNRSGEQLTRAGVTYILTKYAEQARIKNPNFIPQVLTPHCFRHSKAMHLLQAGVTLIYIRDFLGHEKVKTTEVYAKADSDIKRKALENVYSPIIDDSQFQGESWNDNPNLMNWLIENFFKK